MRAVPGRDHGKSRLRKARYLRAVLLARIYEAFPLTYPHCAGEMRIIALVTDPASIQAILAHMGEPTRPPPLAPARDSPAWAGGIDAGEVMDRKGEPAGIEALAQPEREFIFDPRITGSKYTPWR
jgi:hypothetical protein